MVVKSSTKKRLVELGVSEEHAHKLVLEALRAKPMIDLGLRLGEGTGAALAYPLVLAAAAFYNDMASFDSAGVTV